MAFSTRGTVLQLNINNVSRESMSTVVSKSERDDETAYVLVADDHPIVLCGLRELIESQPGMAVLGTAATVAELTAALSTVQPSLLIMDLSLGNADGVDLLKSLRALHPQLRVLVFSMHDELDYADRVIRAGALGYVMKDNASDQLLLAMRAALRGQVFRSDAMRRALGRGVSAAKPVGVEALTDRELSIFRMIGNGQTTRSIATSLHRSIKTVEKHRENIKRKLGLDCGAKLAREAAIYVARGNGSGSGNGSDAGRDQVGREAGHNGDREAEE